jgi:RecJ-like exonuclease
MKYYVSKHIMKGYNVVNKDTLATVCNVPDKYPKMADLIAKLLSEDVEAKLIASQIQQSTEKECPTCHGSGCYIAFICPKCSGAGSISQPQQTEYTFDELTKMLMQAATKEGHKVTMKISWAEPPAPTIVKTEKYIRAKLDAPEFHVSPTEEMMPRPHQDGDFSYMCQSEYCRCKQ